MRKLLLTPWPIIALFCILGGIYSIAVPIFEASDELWHYPMVQHIARTWTLPVQPLEPGAVSGPWRQEASQPPLYYALGAALTAWIDTSDMAQVRHLNPHVAAGEVTPDGSNVNLVVHNPALERFPWKGTVLAVHLVRLFSVALGAWAVYLTWALVRELYPDPPWLALAAAATHAFTPMYLFISASVNNDNLIVPLCSWALLLMVKRIKNQRISESASQRVSESADQRVSAPQSSVLSPQSSVLAYLLLGVVIGLGLLTKASAIGLLPLAAATVAWEAWQEIKTARERKNEKTNQRISGSADQRVSGSPPLPLSPSPPPPVYRLPSTVYPLLSTVTRLLATLLPALALSGWWFLRNARLYGDWLGLNAFYAVLGTRDIPADLAQLWAERHAFAAGYWGNFGGLNVLMPGWIYTLLNLLAALAALGLAVRFAFWVLGYESKIEGQKSKVSRSTNQQINKSTNQQIPQSSVLSPQSFKRLWPFAWDPLTAARALAWAWPAAVFVSWVRWATITWSSQGRLIFSALPMWSLALVMGIQITNGEWRMANGEKAKKRESEKVGQRVSESADRQIGGSAALPLPPSLSTVYCLPSTCPSPSSRSASSPCPRGLCPRTSRRAPPAPS